MNVSGAIRLKRAVRQFADQPLPEETILAILQGLSQYGRVPGTWQAWLWSLKTPPNVSRSCLTSARRQPMVYKKIDG